MVTAVCSRSLPKEEEDLDEKESIPSEFKNEEWKEMLEFHPLVMSQ